MNKFSGIRFLLISPGIIAGFLLIGTILAYLLSAIYFQFHIDISDFPLPISALFTLVLIPTDIIGESFGEMFSLNGKVFIVCWTLLLMAIILLSFFSSKKIHPK